MPKACLQCAVLPQCRGGYRLFTSDHQFKPDSLMKQPITEIPSYLIELNSQLKPIPCFKVRRESFGYLLTRYNYSVPVSHQVYALLIAIDGKNTLAQLKDQFGEDALDLVGYLFQKKFILFE